MRKSRQSGRVGELSETLRSEIAQELRVQFNFELQSRIADVRREFEGSSTPPTALADEIAAVREDLEKKETELATTLAADSFAYGTILKLQMEKLELTSYLRGLNFHAKTAGTRI